MAATDGRSREEYIAMAKQIAETLRRPAAMPPASRLALVNEAALYVELAKLAPEEQA